MSIGKSRITPEHRAKAKELGECMYEVLVNTRFTTHESRVGTKLDHLKEFSTAGVCTVAEADRLLCATKIIGDQKAFRLVESAPELLDIAKTLQNQYWQAGVQAVKDSNDPMEMLHFKVSEVLAKLTIE